MARRRLARDFVVLASGSGVAGVLVFVFFALATRSLGASGAAPVSLLWSYWAIAAAVLTFAVQHWTIRTLAHDGHGGTVARSLPMLGLAAVGLALVAGAVAYAFGFTLFGVHGTTYPVLVAGITLGSLFMGLVRGALAGRGRYVATAVSLAGENAVRVAAAAGVALLGGDAVAFGLALVAGPLIGLVWLSSLRFSVPVEVQAHRAAEPRHPRTPPDRVRNPLALVSGIAGGSLIAQVALTGAPVVLAAVGGAPAEVTSLFVALAVWRAPYILAIGVSPRLTAVVTRLAVAGRRARLAWLRRLCLAGVLAGGALAALAGATVLLPLLRLAFGAGIDIANAYLSTLGGGTALAFGNLVLLLMLLAYGRSRAATFSWTAALAVSAGWLVLAGTPPTHRVVTGFLLAQLVAFALLYVFARPPTKPLAATGAQVNDASSEGTR